MDARFHARIARSGPDDCWLWTGSTDREGYGRFGRKINGSTKFFYAHREAARAAGVAVDGLFVCHLCDHPLCCNPRHLFVGTHVENMADMTRKGRRSSQVGSLNGNARLTEDDVRAIRRAGGTNTAVAAEFGVTHQMISKIRARKAWKHVE